MNTEALRVEPIKLETAKAIGDGRFPPALACRDPHARLPELCRWVEDNRSELSSVARREGAVLFREFPLTSADDFDAFVTAFGFQGFSYEESLSNAVRVNVTPRVFTANEAPSEATIGLHHELAQTPVYPSRLIFFCEKKAEHGGATPLCRSDVLFGRLARELPGFVRDCEEQGLVYSNVMPSEDDPDSALGRSWKGTLSVETREQAEAKLRGLGYSWKWSADSLRATTPVLPAVRELGAKRKSFFNQLIATAGWADRRNDPATAVRLGGGGPIPLEVRARVASLAEEVAVDLPWQSGDAALVDNLVTMHGRRSFRGTRRVLAALAAPDSD